MRLALIILVILTLNIELANCQSKDYDIKCNKVKWLKKVYLRYHDNDSISKVYGYQINFDPVGLILKKESWLYPPLQNDTSVHLYQYRNNKLDKIIFKGVGNYDYYQYDSLGNNVQIKRYRNKNFEYSFYLKYDKKGRLIERYLGPLESFEYDEHNRVITHKERIRDSTYEISYYTYSINDLVNKEINEYHEGKNYMSTIINNIYNTKNDLIEKQTQNDYFQESYTTLYNYIYNNEGDWIYRITIANGKINTIERREIEYYK
jgi:hypothetical protein